jgi:hypothetical protein
MVEAYTVQVTFFLFQFALFFKTKQNMSDEDQYTMFNGYSLATLLRKLDVKVPHNAGKPTLMDMLKQYEQKNNVLPLVDYQKRYNEEFTNIIKQKKRRYNSEEDNDQPMIQCDECDQWSNLPDGLKVGEDDEWFCEQCRPIEAYELQNNAVDLPGITIHDAFEYQPKITWADGVYYPVMKRLCKSWEQTSMEHFPLINDCVVYKPGHPFDNGVMQCIQRKREFRWYAFGQHPTCQWRYTTRDRCVPVYFYIVFDRKSTKAYVCPIAERVYVGNRTCSNFIELRQHDIIRYEGINILFIKFFSK